MQFLLVKEVKEKNRLKGLFNRMEETKKNNNNNMLIITVSKKNKISKRKIKKIVRSIKEQNVKIILLSNYLNNINNLREEIINNKLFLIDGKLLFKALLNEILTYICKTGDKDINQLRVTFLTNNAEDINKQIIIELAKKVKNTNIVTNKQQDFKKVEEYLLGEMGIIIELSHNINKNSDIIINFDFNQEELNKYKIPYNCIIINIKEDIQIKLKKFNGIIINNYIINIPNKYKIEGFEDNSIYESYLINKNYKDMVEQIKKDNIKIKYLIGENGIIQKQEFNKQQFTKIIL